MSTEPNEVEDDCSSPTHRQRIHPLYLPFEKNSNSGTQEAPVKKVLAENRKEKGVNKYGRRKEVFSTQYVKILDKHIDEDDQLVSLTDKYTVSSTSSTKSQNNTHPDDISTLQFNPNNHSFTPPNNISPQHGPPPSNAPPIPSPIKSQNSTISFKNEPPSQPPPRPPISPDISPSAPPRPVRSQTVSNINHKNDIKSNNKNDSTQSLKVNSGNVNKTPSIQEWKPLVGNTNSHNTNNDSLKKKDSLAKIISQTKKENNTSHFEIPVNKPISTTSRPIAVTTTTTTTTSSLPLQNFSRPHASTFTTVSQKNNKNMNLNLSPRRPANPPPSIPNLSFIKNNNSNHSKIVPATDSSKKYLQKFDILIRDDDEM